MSRWVLRLIEQYPTPSEVVEAGPETLAEIPYVTEDYFTGDKAKKLVEAARISVARQTDEDTGLNLSLVAEYLLRSQVGSIGSRSGFGTELSTDTLLVLWPQLRGVGSGAR